MNFIKNFTTLTKSLEKTNSYQLTGVVAARIRSVAASVVKEIARKGFHRETFVLHILSGDPVWLPISSRYNRLLKAEPS